MIDFLSALIWLMEFSPGMGLDEIKSEYYERVSEVMLDYMLSDKPVTSFRNSFDSLAADAFLLSSVAGWADAGAEGPISDDLTTYVNTRLDAEFRFIEDLFKDLKDLRKAGDEDAQINFIVSRANGYAKTLDGIYAYAKLLAAPEIMLTFTGEDGVESCQTCKGLKGRKHKASWWIEHEMIPGQPGNPNYECGGWRCQHYLITKDGERWIN